jgi:adenine-specific DNA-methyltransferase
MTARRGAKKAAPGPLPVDVITHRDKRANIPTDELRDLVAEDEATPKLLRLQRERENRDDANDPQLVWRGKDQQDVEDLAIPVVPIYIQEKIHPQVLIENLRSTAAGPEEEPELTLFNDFNGIEFNDLVNFYQHEQNWTNRLILGDSLLVMASLAEKEGLRGKVQTIFFDPPYGIGFGSNFQTSTEQREVKDGKAADMTRQPEQIRAFRDTWKDGVNSYLTYLRDRLTVARDLLTESGNLFVQIGDENVHLVRSLMDEVLGPENFVSLITFAKTTGASGDLLPGSADYIVWYAKDRRVAKFRSLFRAKTVGGEGGTGYRSVELSDGTRRAMTAPERVDPSSVPSGARIYALDNLTSQSAGREKGEGAASWFPVEFDGEPFTPGNGRWKTNEQGMERLLAARRVGRGATNLGYVRFFDDFPVMSLGNVWTDTVGQNQFGGDKVYVVQTGLKVVQRCLLMTTDPGDLVLDPTNGSGTTAVVAEEWGRRWISIDTSRVAVALTRTRLAALKLPYYLLSDSKAGDELDAKLGARRPAAGPFGGDVRRGFVYRRVPHIMLKDIAQNPEIESGMSAADIDAAIARNSAQELLFDQPYDDKKVVRVCGPFTVESLSPHRVIAEQGLPATERIPDASGGYEETILGNLIKAGVQNRDKAQRLDFDAVEPFAGGRWLHAKGTFTDEGGESRTVAISLGPEYGTVGPEQVKEAAKEAVKGVGFDLVLMLGFSFDARCGEAAKEFKADTAGGGWLSVANEHHVGRLSVLLVKMNPDLSMGEDLLKATGAGNLFMVFGEPDVKIDRVDDDEIEVEILGVDVYDPRTGEIRSNTTDEIACWFIDTNYNEESFFVRDAYFTGASKPYDRLKKALKADIDEDAWASLYRTRSRAFAKPATGKIAVKVINHYGDEVLKVYAVD